jgi:hypothetical protein
MQNELPTLPTACLNLPELASGEVAEWLNVPHPKCGIRATVSGVQISPSAISYLIVCICVGLRHKSRIAHLILPLSGPHSFRSS